MTTAAYLRVSSEIQAQGNSVDSQRLAVEAWAAARGETIRAENWYVDEAVSGATMQRPAWVRLMKEAREGRVKTIVLYDLSRAGRTLRGLCDWFEEIDRLGVRAAFVRDGPDLNTATGRLLAQIIGAIAEWDRVIRAERIRDGVRAKIAKTGRWGGKRPPAISDEQYAAVRHLLGRGKVRRVAREYGLSHSALLRRWRADKDRLSEPDNQVPV